MIKTSMILQVRTHLLLLQPELKINIVKSRMVYELKAWIPVHKDHGCSLSACVPMRTLSKDLNTPILSSIDDYVIECVGSTLYICVYLYC